MADKIILVDTSVLIDFYRKTDKNNSVWIRLVRQGYEATVDTAVNINAGLKRKRKQVDLADLFISATAITHHLPFATLNRKHFDRIDELTIVE